MRVCLCVDFAVATKHRLRREKAIVANIYI